MSDLEQAFLTRLKQLAPELPEPEQQVLFCKEVVRNGEFTKTGRKRKPQDQHADFGWSDKKILIECHGMYRKKKSYGYAGNHLTPTGWQKDLMRANYAQRNGWVMLQFSSEQITNHPDWCIEIIRDMYNSR